VTRRGEEASQPGVLEWAFGPPAVPALALFVLFGLLLATVGLMPGSLGISFVGVGSTGSWVFVTRLLLALLAALVRVAIRSYGARVVAYRGDGDIQTEERPYRVRRIATSSERTTRP
jgi:hypothetical protein